jgi:formate dehydrogenase subunit gamma
MDTTHSWDRDTVQSIAESLKGRPGALMLILRSVQDTIGWVPRDSVPLIAEILNLSRAEVHGVVSFYHDFRHEPPAKNVIKVCRAESCQAMGAVALAEHVKQRLNCDFGHSSADGAFTLDAVYCFGNCACSPAVMVNGKLLGRVTPSSFDEALAKSAAAR